MARKQKPRSFPGVRLQRGDFDVGGALRAARRADCGALVVYLGTVRASPHGGGKRRVVRLSYEAFPAMALVKLARVRADALARFDIKELFLHHRIGSFAVGENVVMCVVAAAHREAAIAAARFAVAEMKQTVPIWKKEVYRGGGAKWVVGEMRPGEVVARPRKRARPSGG